MVYGFVHQKWTILAIDHISKHIYYIGTTRIFIDHIADLTIYLLAG